MKQKLLLKSLLLLCALVVGTNAWADTGSITITISSFSGLPSTADYDTYDWSNGGVSGKATIYGSSSATSMQFNASNKLLYSTSGINGRITSIKMTTASGTNRTYVVYGSTSAYTGSGTSYGTQIGSETVTTSGTTFNVSSGDYTYFTIVKSGSGAGYISEIVVNYETMTKHTLSSAVSPTGVGTVTLGSTSVGEGKSTTIEATVTNPAYRFKNWTKTSGTIANINAASTTFTMGTEDATVTAVFEEIPTHTLDYVITPVGAGTVTLGSTSVKEGSTTTATAAPAAGYKFTEWSISGTGASLSSTTTNPTTVTMGTANATVTATFEAVTTHAISYSVNGVIVDTKNVEEDAAVDLSAPTSGIPAGYVFRGWVVEANKINTPTDTDPSANYVTSATSTEDITYYAVIAIQKASSPDTYEKLSNNSFDSKATYVIGATQGGSGGNGITMMYFDSYNNTDEDISWGSCTSTPSTVTPVYFTLSGTAAALKAMDNSDNYLTCISVKNFAMSSSSATIYLDTDGKIKSASDGNLLRYNYNNGSGGLRWYASTTGAQAYFYKVIDNNTYANYCTSLPTSVSITPAKIYTTLTSAYPLNFTSVSSDLKAYIATTISGDKVQMVQVNKVPANTGLVLKASSTGSPIVVPVLTGAADDLTGNKMAGSATATTAIAANGGYILKDGVFQPALAGTLPAGKAYLNIAVPAGAPILNLGFDDATGIESIAKSQELTANGQYYNLAGQRVAQPTKGLYIVNGKKYIVK